MLTFYMVNLNIGGYTMEPKQNLTQALDQLAAQFPHLHWNFRPDPSGTRVEYISQWLGEPDEDCMVCAFKGNHIHERFHRQDFFFFNFAYTGSYIALSAQSQHQVLMEEGDCYLGQPYSGYALRKNSPENCLIVGVLIKTTAFYRYYLSQLAADPALFHFFLEPKLNRYADGCLHFPLPPDSPVWQLLNLMILEYVNPKPDTQQILQSLALSLTFYIARAYHQQHQDTPTSLTDQILAYMETHWDTVTLETLGKQFGFHPASMSRLIKQNTGQTFSQQLLHIRLTRAKLPLAQTQLPVEEIDQLSGYNDPSNFYRAYKKEYGETPRGAL